MHNCLLPHSFWWNYACLHVNFVTFNAKNTSIFIDHWTLVDDFKLWLSTGILPILYKNHLATSSVLSHLLLHFSFCSLRFGALHSISQNKSKLCLSLGKILTRLSFGKILFYSSNYLHIQYLYDVCRQCAKITSFALCHSLYQCFCLYSNEVEISSFWCKKSGIKAYL